MIGKIKKCKKNKKRKNKKIIYLYKKYLQERKITFSPRRS